MAEAVFSLPKVNVGSVCGLICLKKVVLIIPCLFVCPFMTLPIVLDTSVEPMFLILCCALLTFALVSYIPVEVLIFILFSRCLFFPFYYYSFHIDRS